MFDPNILENGLRGVILSREFYGEKNIVLKIFLENIGIFPASVFVGTSGRNHFGGDAEALNWCTFTFKREKKTKYYQVENIENYDDLMHVRKRYEALKTALRWVKDILKYMPFEQPDNQLLVKLYWNMFLLKNNEIPVEAVDFRFYWQWLSLWGIAKKFKENEINAIKYVTDPNRNKITQLFRTLKEQNYQNIDQIKYFFSKTTKIIKPFFYEK